MPVIPRSLTNGHRKPPPHTQSVSTPWISHCKVTDSAAGYLKIIIVYQIWRLHGFNRFLVIMRKDVHTHRRIACSTDRQTRSPHFQGVDTGYGGLNPQIP